MSAALRRFALQQVSRNVRRASDHTPAHYKPVMMDELPVPSGSWQSDYNAKQAKYNKQLLLGGGFFVITLIVMASSNLIDLNFTPPPFPVKKE